MRLPSLYDMAAPNPRDICEIVLTACRGTSSIPQGLTFPMTDVRTAAAFLVGLPPLSGPAWFNLIADDNITPDGHGMRVLSPADWLAQAGLPDGVRRLIKADPLILATNARFDNTAASAALPAIFAQVCDAPDLIARRLYHSEPALI